MSTISCLRPSYDKSDYEGKELTFQVIDIVDQDTFPILTNEEESELYREATEAGESVADARRQKYPKQYRIRMSGVMENGIPVSLDVGGFCPFFYVRVPEFDTDGRQTLSRLDQIRRAEISRINEKDLREHIIRIQNRAMDDEDLDDETLTRINDEIKSKLKEDPKRIIAYLRGQLKDIVWPPQKTRRRDLYWYRGEDAGEDYYRLEFKTKSCYYTWLKILLDSKNRPTTIEYSTDRQKRTLKVYEANLEPTLRFIHACRFQACGWVKIPADEWEFYPTNTNKSNSGSGSSTDSEDDDDDEEETTHDSTMIHSIHARCSSYTSVQPCSEKSQESAPILIASFDIECDSAHGDFPLAKKHWEREIKIIEEYQGLGARTIAYQLIQSLQGKKTDLFGKLYLKNKLSNEDLTKMITTEGIQKIIDVLTTGRENKENPITECQSILSNLFNPIEAGELEGDRIIQIGTTFYRNGKIVARHIATAGGCNPAGVPNTVVVAIKSEEDEVSDCMNSNKTEAAVIKEWIRLIHETDPDIITGYNISFFDMAYIYERCEELGLVDKLLSGTLSRFPGGRCRFKQMNLSSAAMGDNFLRYIDMPGRVVLDLCAAVRRNFSNLDSYKLDNVAQEFLFGKVSKATISGEDDPTIVWIHTKDTFGANVGGYIHVCDEDGDDIGGKLSVLHIGPSPSTMFPPEQKMKMIVAMTKDAEDSAEIVKKATRWTQAKDDVPPSQIFLLQKGSDDDRAVIAKYCVQDCDLVLDLLTKLDIVSNAMAMGSVCSVPFPYIFFRGQTIKLSSLLFDECEKAGLIVPVMPAPTFEEMNDSYEGAVVLEPKTGLYLEQPVAVLDYNSLYPSSMISENISHDTIIAIWDKDKDGKVVSTKGDIRLAESLPSERFVDVTFDRYEPDPEDKRKNPEKIKVGTRTCRYYQFEDKGKKGIIGTILKELLSKRKETKKRMDKESDPFKKALLNSLQLAYKVTANSLYGALGAKNSKIRFQDLAASTTAVGRSLIMYAKEGLERAFGRSARSDCKAAYVYGDTDSVFVAFNPVGADGKPLRGRDAVEASIRLGKEAGKMLSSALREPHNLEYEKTFYPFALFSKKRYIGMKYEDDPDHCKQANMGVVLKRRDNAPIVKEIYQAVVDMIMKERDLAKSVDVARDIMRRLVNGEYSLKKLTITKSLRAHYANPEQIAHKVLAERIGVRDPGNKPKSNDRIAFVYFDSTKTRDGAKQGDRIETPEYIVEHKLQPDYKHYITNQIQKPLTQLFQLFWTQVPDSKVSDAMIRAYRAEHRMNPLITKEKIELQIERMLEADIERVVFNDVIRQSVNIRKGPMDMFIMKGKSK